VSNPLRKLGFTDLVSRKNTPNRQRRAARGAVPGKRQEIAGLDAAERIEHNEARIAALEAENATILAALKAAGMIP
jgi:hypothetical protein